MHHSRNGDPGSSSSSTRKQLLRAVEVEESAPLLGRPSTGLEAKRHSKDYLDLEPNDTEISNPSNRRDTPDLVYHSSDESCFLNFVMEKLQSPRWTYYADKLAVESEPGLTNAQLMAE